MKNVDYLMLNKITGQEFLNLNHIIEEDLDKELIIMLEKAYKECDSENVEVAIYLIFYFEHTNTMFVDILNQLLICDWHEQHENISILLKKLKSPSSVHNLYVVANRKFEYLEYDENYALAVKCIWALGDIGTDLAKQKLNILSASLNDIIANNALMQLKRIEERK